MARKPEGNQRSHACGHCMKGQGQTRKGWLPPQLMQDLLEFVRARQAGAGAGAGAGARARKARPLCITNGCNPRSAPNATPPNANPSVLLPLGLGSINVPLGAHRVDIRFNCVSNRLPTGHVTHRLVVHVDVTYNPPSTTGAAGSDGARHANVASPKSEGGSPAPDRK